MATTKFKKRYVLGEGLPFVEAGKEVKWVALSDKAEGVPYPVIKALAWPKELDVDATPRYRLILERVN